MNWEPVTDPSTLHRGTYVRAEQPEHYRSFSILPQPEVAFEGRLIEVRHGTHLVLQGHRTIFLDERPTAVYRRTA